MGFLLNRLDGGPCHKSISIFAPMWQLRGCKSIVIIKVGKIALSFSKKLIDVVTQSKVVFPVILFPSLKTLNPKIVNKETALRLLQTVEKKFPIGHEATIQSVHECADLKNMFAAIQKFLKLCGHDLDE